jgi:hypothetical protein
MTMTSDKMDCDCDSYPSMIWKQGRVMHVYICLSFIVVQL